MKGKVPINILELSSLKASRIISKRKDEHLEICLNDDIDFSKKRTNGFDNFNFEHDSLPELNYELIDTSCSLFGKILSAPLIIGAMTGGTEKAMKLNRRLARAAAQTQIGFALGSQRKLLHDSSTLETYSAKSWEPKLPLLFGNIGAVQLNYGVGLEEIKYLVKSCKLDVINFHLNPLQEAVQNEGNTDFRNLIKYISKISNSIDIPVVIKEVGCGISLKTATKLSKLPISGVETSGKGGTSWSLIEAKRSDNDLKSHLGKAFSEWGVPTTDSIIYCRKTMPRKIVIASGGIRSGIEVAKAISLGADACAMALPFLKSAEISTEAVVLQIRQIKEELKLAMFLTGSKNINSLKKNKLRSK